MRGILAGLAVGLSALMLSASAAADGSVGTVPANDPTAPPSTGTMSFPNGATSYEQSVTNPDGSVATFDVGQLEYTLAPSGANVIGGGTNLGGDGGTTTAAPCGTVGYYGQAKYSLFGVVVYTYQETFDVNFCNRVVTRVNYQTSGPTSNCCGWSWAGTVAMTHSPTGYSNITGYSRGHFTYAYKVLDKYPWVQLIINGNGLLTGFTWSAG